MGSEGSRLAESERGVWFWLKRHSICTPCFIRKNELIVFRGRKTVSAPKFWSPGITQSDQRWVFDSPVAGFVQNVAGAVCLNVYGCKTSIIYDSCTSSGPGACSGES